MFNHFFNGLGDFHDVADNEDLDWMMGKQQKVWVLFRDAVLPGLKSQVADVKREQQMKIDARKQVESLYWRYCLDLGCYMRKQIGASVRGSL